MKVLFVVNPAAGVRTRAVLRLLKGLRRVLPFRHELALTTGPGDAQRLAAEAGRSGYDIVAAVGGDGTVNEVGRGLLTSPRTQLGIVPTGSGNGIARHLRIPMEPRGAIERLVAAQPQPMDVGYINGSAFFCTAGLGFDANISRRFASTRRRGLVGYARTALLSYSSYHSTPIEIRSGDETLTSNCYVLAFANASQYGNNVVIAPNADLADGRLDVCLIDEMPILRAMRVAYGLAAGDLPRSRAAKFFTSQEMDVTAARPIEYHADGDFLGEARTFHVRVERHGLTVRA